MVLGGALWMWIRPREAGAMAHPVEHKFGDSAAVLRPGIAAGLEEILEIPVHRLLRTVQRGEYVDGGLYAGSRFHGHER